MTSIELTKEQIELGYRPLAGRILVELERPDTMAGALHIPQVAQTQTPERTQLLIGRVLAIGYGCYVEGGESFGGILRGDLNRDDRILIAPLLQDLNKGIVLTSVTRVEGVLEP